MKTVKIRLYCFAIQKPWAPPTPGSLPSTSSYLHTTIGLYLRLFCFCSGGWCTELDSGPSGVCIPQWLPSGCTQLYSWWAVGWLVVADAHNRIWAKSDPSVEQSKLLSPLWSHRLLTVHWSVQLACYFNQLCKAWPGCNISVSSKMYSYLIQLVIWYSSRHTSREAQ